jgi:glycosyltransferase involved in cell wall biosynthesis
MRPAAGQGGGKHGVIVVTDNRFWRAHIGSQVRIHTLLQHLRISGWDVQVAFHGRPYLDDAAQAAALNGISVRFLHAQEGVSLRQPPATPGVLAQARAHVGHGLRWTRALRTQWHRSAGARGAAAFWSEIRLRAREPRVGDGADPALLELVHQMASAQTRPVILVEYLRLAWVERALRPIFPRATWVLDTHDVMHERQARFHASGEAHDLDVSAREEARWLSNFDAVLAIQARDARTLIDIGVQSQVLTVPNPVAAQRMPSSDPAVVGVGFLGSDMAPNRRALQELVLEVWPLVERGARTPVLLVVAGAVSTVLQHHTHLPPSVRVLGVVGDLAEFYGQIDIVASPLRFGGGLKVKNVEALCRGKALVTTDVGAEGLEQAAPHALAVTRDPAEMAEALLAWIHDPAARTRAMDAGFSFAQQHFDPATTFRSLDEFLASVVQRA